MSVFTLFVVSLLVFLLLVVFLLIFVATEVRRTGHRGTAAPRHRHRGTGTGTGTGTGAEAPANRLASPRRHDHQAGDCGRLRAVTSSTVQHRAGESVTEHPERPEPPAGSVLAEPVVPGGLDVNTPNIARVYDALLGGKDNFEADRAVARQIIEVIAPHGDATEGPRLIRAALVRAVRYLTTTAGIDQFLDLGSGLPTQQNVHDAAQRYRPGARVVYVGRLREPAARQPQPLTVAAGPTTVACEDAGTARDIAASCAAWYLCAMGDVYARSVSSQGYGAEVSAIVAANPRPSPRRGVIPADAQVVLDQLAAYGTRGQVREQLEPWDLVADIVMIVLPPGMPWHAIDATLLAAAPGSIAS